MDAEQELSLEERLAQAMIDMRKGPSSHTIKDPSVQQRRDYLIAAIEDVKKEIEAFSEENDILNILIENIESIRNQINPAGEIDAHLIAIKHGKCHDTRDISIQTEPDSSGLLNLPHKAEKFKLINNLTTKEKVLQEKLKNLQLSVDLKGPNYILLKLVEYNDLVSQIASMSPDDSTLYADMEIENVINVPSTNVQTNYSPDALITTPTKIGITTNTSNNNNGAVRSHEESDDEGVQLLLSMKRNAFNCKCGEYLNSITDWSEHQRICSKSTEQTIGEQCQLCKKTFLTCVALNIHSTKKHNKKKIRTDSVMHCPCGQSFTAKWRQNCVHKLNSHGRHCKAFKEIETQCSICKKGFIDRKSLEYHGLKAHKLAVPVNS